MKAVSYYVSYKARKSLYLWSNSPAGGTHIFGDIPCHCLMFPPPPSPHVHYCPQLFQFISLLDPNHILVIFNLIQKDTKWRAWCGCGDRSISTCSRLTWFTYWVPGQPGLHDTLEKGTRKRGKRQMEERERMGLRRNKELEIAWGLKSILAGYFFLEIYYYCV